LPILLGLAEKLEAMLALSPDLSQRNDIQQRLDALGKTVARQRQQYSL